MMSSPVMLQFNFEFYEAVKQYIRRQSLGLQSAILKYSLIEK